MTTHDFQLLIVRMYQEKEFFENDRHLSVNSVSYVGNYILFFSSCGVYSWIGNHIPLDLTLDPRQLMNGTLEPDELEKCESKTLFI